MSKIKQFIKNISPLNNRTEMPIILYIIKVIIIFWFVKFGAEIIGEGIVIAICFTCGKNPLRGEIFSANIMMLMMYYGYFVLIGIMILYWKLFQKKTLSELGFTRKAGSYMIGVVMGTVLVVISVLLIVFTGAISYNGMFDNIDIGFILLMFAGFIFQGAMEEVLCRGIVMQLLIKKTNIPVAILISSMLFIIPHLFNIEKVSGGIIFFTIVNLFLISIVFSLLTIYFKNIWVVCGFHTVWNFILYNIFGMNLSGNDEIKAAVFDMRSVGSNILNGGIYGIEASVVTAVVLAITVVIMIFIMKRKAL
ncbi:CAAX protease self-immunity [Lachnospiraceae bacterium RM5]|nr:CAAX protease self-immunity [Lachnospiraceae bacterium RM5]